MRKMIIAAALGAALLGCTASAAPAATTTTAHHRTTCGWLRDGTGHGSALSAKPGRPVTQGQIATVQNISNAWTVCQGAGSPAKVWLNASPGWCLADFGGHAIWEGCGGDNPEFWTPRPQSGGGYALRDQTQGFNLYIGPSDGVGSQVISTAYSGLSPYHRTWLFSQARKGT